MLADVIVFVFVLSIIVSFALVARCAIGCRGHMMHMMHMIHMILMMLAWG